MPDNPQRVGIFVQALSSPDLIRLRCAMAQVHTPAFFDAFRRLLRGRLRFDTFLMMRFDPSGPPVLLGRWVKRDVVPSDALDPYIAGAYRLDPFYQRADVPPAGALYRLSDIAPDRFYSSAYFLSYFRLTRLRDEVGLLAPLPSGSVAHLSFSRRDLRGTFRRREVQCLQHYSPILLELLATHCQHLQLNDPRIGPRKDTASLDQLIRDQVTGTQAASLTAREAQIAALVLQGHSNASAALSLGIARETAKVHRRNLYGKLAISSQGELFGMLGNLL